MASVEKRALVMARTATGDNDEALDLVQDAMLRLVKHYSGRPAAEWGPLFHRILQSRIRDWYRRAQVRNRFRVWFSRDSEDKASDIVEQQPDQHNPAPDMSMASSQTIVALEAGLRKLPLRQQQAFLLRVWEGLDVAQTADAMRCSQGSVKTHYSRALRSLRESLEDFH